MLVRQIEREGENGCVEEKDGKEAQIQSSE